MLVRKNSASLPLRGVLLASLLFAVFGGTALSAYEGDWTDKKLDAQVTEANSWFKVDGQVWGAYEFADRKPDRSLDYSGFTLGRATINVQGQGKSGEADGWGYRVLLEANTSNGSAFTGTTAPPTPFLKYAYFQIPVVKGTFFRVGFQQSPTVDGQAGSSLEAAWGHRYLDSDGKAMWDELGLSSSSDAGLGFVHKNDWFGLHLLLANGEGYTGAAGVNAKATTLTCAGTTPTPCTTGYIDTAALASGAASTFRYNEVKAIGQGNAASYGLDLYGMFSLTPLKAEKDSGFDLSINFPFRLQNVYGVRGQEYQNVVDLDFNPASPKFSLVQGAARAKKDRSVGVEIDTKAKFSSDSSISFGVGGAQKTDVQTNTYVLDETVGAMSLQNYLVNGYYYQGANAVGTARYVFLHGRAGKYGFVTRFSTGTGSCTGYSTCTISERLGTSIGNPLSNEFDLNNVSLSSGAPSNAAIKSIVQADRGQSHFRKATVALTFMPNERMNVAAGIHVTTMTDSQGKNAMVYGLSNQIATTGQSPLAAAASTNASLNTAIAQGFLTDANTMGTKNYDRQAFVRMEYKY